ncbi:hypothetical protein BDE02_01G258600 [Populus trichocarpa]|jgi:hypothetical protein|nr:hypothetical protein BDE02_01G258600 [Populus trichocarpa]KAI5604036.1 hypothetical protein BDE02_01G258600 [Populus trichocarpa]
MIKRSPSRNPRSKGIKAKNVLQICLLLGVCFWLIYQVKHSHDKKKELQGKDASFSQKTLSHDVLPKLGRKDPHPGLQDKTSEKNEEEEEEDTGMDEEGNKKEENRHEKEDEEGGQEGGGTKDDEVEREEEHMHEKEEQIEHEEDERNEEANSEENNDEGREVGDDEVDERDREKIEGEADPDGEFMDEEKEREDDEGEKKESQGNEGGGKEIQGNEDEDREVQTDNETQSEDQDHDGGKNSHVAREEHYMADDASSAVTHDTQIRSTEPEKEGLEKSNENLAAADLQQEKHSINDNPLDVNGDKNNSTSQLEQAENGHSLNATTDEKKNDETTVAKSEDESPNNTTVTVLSIDQSVSSNKSTEVSSEAGDKQVSEHLEVPGTSQQNGMLNVSDSTQIRNATVDVHVTGDIANLQTTQSEQVNDGIISEGIQSDSNSKLLGQTENANSFGNDSSNSSSNSESGGSDKTIKKPEVIAAEDVNSGFSSGTNETTEATHDENSGTIHESGGTDENTISSTTNETGDAVIHDPNDSSIGQDEREARIDLGTLPDIGGVDNGNVAEE